MDGLLLVDKPVGWTSHDIVAKLRGITKMRRIGHAGTLDPFATGLLLIGIGAGTKSLHALTGADKTYLAEVTFGATSTTFDPEGVLTPVEPPPTPCSPSEIETALNQFRGGYDQYAPLFSAKKRQGAPLYQLARQGIATEEMRPSKRVTISELTIQSYNWPTLALLIRCGSGTYIRSLGDDLGRALQVGAYVSALRRTTIGSFSLNHALSFDPIPSLSDVENALFPLVDNTNNLLDRAKNPC
jgi:tRNA pseudouridine55 synthase